MRGRQSGRGGGEACDLTSGDTGTALMSCSQGDSSSPTWDLGSSLRFRVKFTPNVATEGREE